MNKKDKMIKMAKILDQIGYENYTQLINKPKDELSFVKGVGTGIILSLYGIDDDVQELFDQIQRNVSYE